MEPIKLWRCASLLDTEKDEVLAYDWCEGPVDDPDFPQHPNVEYAALPRAEYDALVAERDALRGRVEEAEGVVIALRSLHAEGGRVDAKFSGEFVKAFSAGFVQMYRDSGAKNYLDIKFVDRTTGETYTVTVQRDLGKTAHALRTEAESARDAATARAERAEAALRESRRAHLEREDGWYSCPKAPDYIDGGGRGGGCDCGADAWNARIDALLDTPTDDDGRGEDGAWAERGVE